MRALLVPVFSLALMGQSPSLATLKLGDPMPAFSLPGIDGNSFNSKLIQGPILVLFLSTHCPKVQALEARINALAKSSFGSSVVFIGINSNEGEGIERMKRHAQEKEISFHYLKDGSQDVARAFGAGLTPDCFLFNRGKLIYHGRIGEGGTDPTAPGKDLMGALQSLEGGFTPNPEQAPTDGCPIKRKGSR